MKTIVRTVLLAALACATLYGMSLAADPTPVSVPASAAPQAATSIVPGAAPLGAVPQSAPAALSQPVGLPPAPSQPAGSQSDSTPPGNAQYSGVQPAAMPQAPVQPGPDSTAPGGPASNGSPPGNFVYNSMNGQPSAYDTMNALASPFGPTFFFNGYFGQGVGWTQPSYQFDLYYPWHVVAGQSAFFGVLNGAVTNFSKGYTNAGFGYRQYSPEWNRIFGAWGWLDYDDSHDIGFLRYGASLEWLGKYLDVRANWYILNNQKQWTLSDGMTGNPFFLQNFIMMNRTTVTETAFDGGDLEIGGPLPFLGRYGFSGYAGPYYVHSVHSGDGVGAMGRINVAATDNFQVNVSIQNDPIFKMSTFVNVSWRLPDGIPTKWFKPMAVKDRLNSMVIRKDRIPVLDETTVTPEPLLNPKDNEPIFVVHVDPTHAAGSGNGTFESPFGTIAQAQAINNPGIDIFRILPGNPLHLQTNGPFQLLDDQLVLGSTTQHALISVQTPFLFPGFTPGPLPVVSNADITSSGPGSYVFALANRDQISGIGISGADAANTTYGNGIGNLSPIAGFDLNQNQFTNYENGIALTDATGTPADNTPGLFLNNGIGQILNNTMTGLAGTSLNGLSVSNGLPGTLDLMMSGNTSSGNSENGYFVQTTGVGTVINATVDANTASDNTEDSANGFHFQATNGSINVNAFVDNTVTNNAGNGAWFDAVQSGAIQVVNFEGNTVTNNGTAPALTGSDGVLVSANGVLASASANIGSLGGAPNTISNNGLSGVGGAGVHFLAENSGTLSGSVVNNIISNNVSFGVNLDAVQGTVGVIGQNGVAPSDPASTAQPFVIAANTIDANGDAGIFVRLQGSSTAGVVITQNSVTGTTNGPSPFAAGEGIHIRTEGTSFLWDTDIESNFIGITAQGSAHGNASHGIEIESSQSSQLTDTVRFGALQLVQILNNTVEFNGGDGINFTRNGDSLLDNVLVANNVSTNNTGNGLKLFLSGGDIDVSNGGGPLTINFQITDNNFSSNGISGANFYTTADAPLVATVNGNTMSHNGQDGITAETEYFGQIQGEWFNNILTSNGRYGIGFIDADTSGFSFGTPVGHLVVDNNTIQLNTSDGINFSSQPLIPLGGGDAFIDINNNMVTQNGGVGINFSPSGSSVVNTQILDNTISFNGSHGIELFAQEFSIINAQASQNIIQNNGGDGINVTTQTGQDWTTEDPTLANLGNGIINATFTDNNVSYNNAHGINLLNQWSGQMTVDIEGTVNPNTTPNPSADTNVIDGNGLDGILVTNFVDPTLSQNRPVLSELELKFLPGNNINLTVNQTEISGNGVNATTPDDGDGLFIRVGTSENGAVTAVVTNNHFSGNRNIDVVTQSFVATIQPSNTSLYNTDGSFNAEFQPDPIARLNFTLTGNVGQEIDVTRLGAFYSGPALNQPDANKSITGFWNDPSISSGGGTYFFGPGDAPPASVRSRNAQRDVVVDTLDNSGKWPEAVNANETSPDSVSGATAPTTTAFSATFLGIGVNNLYAGALVTFVSGPDAGQTRVISGTNTTNQVITLGAALPVAPAINDKYYVTAPEQAGVGVSTFLTNDPAPHVNDAANGNNFNIVLSDFTTVVPFNPPYVDDAPFPYTWSFSHNFPGVNGPNTDYGPAQPFPQGPPSSGAGNFDGYPFMPFP